MNAFMICCQICGEESHIISSHIKKAHPELSLDDYRKTYPDAPLFSEGYKLKMEKLMKEAGKPVQQGAVLKDMGDREQRAFNEVFGIPDTIKAARRAKDGGPIPIIVMKTAPTGWDEFVPPIDTNYIFPIETTKMVLLGIQEKINPYLVGHAGTGKTTLFEQVCARTNRPMLRVQHTVNMEESHVLGQYVVKNGSTVWEPGPLQLCMKYGVIYLADEYDRAMPQVLSLYQPVLEGKSLVTKEAPPEWRVIKPHPDFQIVATGNTNGAGDDSGLYPSTALQDFANYDRFGLMVKVGWMPEKQEVAVIARQGRCPQPYAEKLVKFANSVRKEFEEGRITTPVGPRALINAAKVGVMTQNFRRGIQLSITEKMNPVDRKACEDLAQRIFGSDHAQAHDEELA